MIRPHSLASSALLLLASVLITGCGSSESPSAAVDADAGTAAAEAEFQRLRQLERGCCDATD